jgi:hypothetical protein
MGISDTEWTISLKIIIILYLCKISIFFYHAIINHSNSFNLSWIPPGISASHIYIYIYIYIYFDRHFAWFKYFTYRYRLVPVLALKYKEHILLLTKVKKARFHYLNFMPNVFISFYFWVEGEATCVKHFKGSANYTILGISALDY